MNTQTMGRLARFAAVGCTGVGVNMGLLILLTEGAGIPYAVSSLVAIEASILSNFTLNNAWTWSDRRDTPLHKRLLKYHAVAGFTAMSTNWLLLLLLTSWFHLDYRLSNAIGIAAGMILNFLLNHAWTFRRIAPGAAEPEDAPPSSPHRRWPNLRAIPVRWTTTLLALLGITIILRFLAMGSMPLLPEEAYYWMYSQHPSLSYYDHPPMIAWVIGAGTRLFGHTEFGVRIGITLLMLASSGLLYRFSRLWFGREPALIAAVALQILPVFFGTGLIATMDAALLFFWLLGLLGISLALRQSRTWGWYLAGLGLGGAMLSKYTGVFLGCGALLALLGHRPWRRHLFTLHPYAGALIGLALFSPVVLWNAQHDWASFRFQFFDRFEGHPFSLRNTGVFLLFQLGVATPAVLAGLAWVGLRAASSRRRLLTPRWLITLAFCLPLLAVMSYKSLRYEIHLNWTLPAYLSALPAVASLGIARWRLARRRPLGFDWQRVAVGSLAVCLLLNAAAIGYLLVLQPHLGWISATAPWQKLAEAVQAVEERVEAETKREPLIVADGKYRLASVLAFYRTPLEKEVRASDFTTSQWVAGGQGLGFPYWAKEEEWAEADCIVVAGRDSIGSFASKFDSFERVAEVPVDRKVYAIAVGRGRHAGPGSH